MVPKCSENVPITLKKFCPSICMVRDMGKFKFIVTFESTEDMEEAYKDIRNNLKLCWGMKKWSIIEVCYTRCVWVEIFGIPPHA